MKTGEEPKRRRTEEPKWIWIAFLVLWFFGSWTFALPESLSAQDIVVSSSASDPVTRLEKAGTIVDYTGTELKLRTTLGTLETVPASRVVEIQTTWSPSYEAGHGRDRKGGSTMPSPLSAARSGKNRAPGPCGRSWPICPARISKRGRLPARGMSFWASWPAIRPLGIGMPSRLLGAESPSRRQPRLARRRGSRPADAPSGPARRKLAPRHAPRRGGSLSGRTGPVERSANCRHRRDSALADEAGHCYSR